ncbi:DNA independent RNA polymerase I transcription factor [Mucor velutinosus]|uniref:DNA independent RNA polymerase I transcription factor n=1 Tax=Mucor velutinosus TaxID=708070 RepID=A0AAN7I1P9_9FUNG|nr:DNA independent RNA polymerase I transcription factor [Mucor velutinosus]
MYITTARPSSGLSGCRVIYNFYPINTDTSAINTTAEITIHRLTSDKMAGLVMNLYGNFAGQLIGKSYQGEDPNQGVNIIDYEDGCYGKFNCWIPTNYTDPYPDLYTTVATDRDRDICDTNNGIDAIDALEDHSELIVTELDTVTVTETVLNVLTLVSTSTTSAGETLRTTAYLTSTSQVIEANRIIDSTSTHVEQDTTTTTTTTESVYIVEKQTTTTITTIIQLVN